MEYYSIIKNDEILEFATIWVELEVMMLSKVSQAQRQVPHNLTQMWNLKMLISFKLKSITAITRGWGEQRGRDDAERRTDRQTVRSSSVLLHSRMTTDSDNVLYVSLQPKTRKSFECFHHEEMLNG